MTQLNSFHIHHSRFFFGDENIALCSTVRRLLSNEVVPSPIVFGGEHGTGKSAVLLAIIDAWNATHDGCNIVSTTAPDVYRSLNDAVKTNDVARLSEAYQTADLLTIDDIHRLAKKPIAQQWLCQVLDHRDRSDLPTIITSNVPIAHLPKFNLRLISRLSCGLNIEIELPSSSTRRSILLFTAQSIGSSLDEPELKRLVAATSGQPFSAIRSRLCSGSESVVHETVSDAAELPREIIRVTAKNYRTLVKELQGPSRRKSVVVPRAVAMFLIREATDLSLIEIGQLLRRRDHTTVRHACLKIEKQLHEDAALRDAVAAIRQAVGITRTDVRLENAS